MSDTKERIFTCNGCGKGKPCILSISMSRIEYRSFKPNEHLRCVLERYNKQETKWEEVQANDQLERDSSLSIDVVSGSALPDGFKVYRCTDCGAINVKRDNGEVRVGFCDECEHPLWN